MTAEVVVMNKSAVALASDSAETISPAQKVFNSAEKLFMLIPGRPVGFLIYNSSEFMQLPWETIVKNYRNFINGKCFDSLQDYANDFLSFLSDPNCGLYSDEQYNITFESIVHYYLSKMLYHIDTSVKKEIEDTAKKISGKKILEIISLWIDKYYQKWDASENQYSDNDIVAIKQDILKYKSIIEKVRDTVFEQAPISDEDKRKIEEFCYSIFYKKKVSDFYTGIVFAGFGENELYPSCVEYIVENFFCNHLKHNMKRVAKIEPKITGWILPFAQQDIVMNFLDGIHPEFEEQLTNELNEVFSPESMVEISNAMKGLTKKRKQTIIDAIEKLKKDKQDIVLEKVQAAFKEDHTDSVLHTMSFLPKDELAKMAESLVNITMFMRRVSMDVESVGGPIDVAVISKKDGFIWIKRKHYFDPTYNPHYNKTYSTGVVP
jgi:hypothetical protein